MNLIKEVVSASYGRYNMELLGKFSFTKLYQDDYTTFVTWLDKHHFKHAFSSYNLMRCNVTKDAEHDTYEVWVCTMRVNKKWDYAHWHSYYNDKRLPKKMPVAISDKSLEKWLNISSKYFT